MTRFGETPGAAVLAPGPEVFTICPAHERQTLKEERQKSISADDWITAGSCGGTRSGTDVSGIDRHC
jgi:hypothetical protein